MIDADEPMMTESWTEAETLAVLNGAKAETPENFLAYSENFFAHGFQDSRKNSEEMQRILGNLEASAKVGNELAGAILGKAVKDGCDYIRRAAEDENYPEAWRAMQEFHERRIGPFKTTSSRVRRVWRSKGRVPKGRFWARQGILRRKSILHD